jgi:hypothetical protein
MLLAKNVIRQEKGIQKCFFRSVEWLMFFFLSRRSNFIAFEIWTIFYCLFVLQLLLLIYFIYSFFEISNNGQKKLDQKKKIYKTSTQKIKHWTTVVSLFCLYCSFILPSIGSTYDILAHRVSSCLEVTRTNTNFPVPWKSLSKSTILK